MRQPNLLRLRRKLGRLAPDKRVAEVGDNGSVDAVADVLDRRAFTETDGVCQVGLRATLLGVDCRFREERGEWGQPGQGARPDATDRPQTLDECELLPDPLEEVVKVEIGLARDGERHVESGESVDLLDRDRVNLVVDIEAGDVFPVAEEDVNELILVNVLADHDAEGGGVGGKRRVSVC